MEGGKLIVFSAPSGSGKTTIVQHLLKLEKLNLDFSISATSREPRKGEVHGQDYYFISLKQFKQHIKKEEFLEWEEVYRDNFYGTLKKEIERIWAKGKNVIFDIDVVGGLRIKKKFPKETLAVFVKPPSVDELKIRLKKRKTESDEKINMRIAKASVELATAPQFDFIIENIDLDIALNEAKELVEKFKRFDSIDKNELTNLSIKFKAFNLNDSIWIKNDLLIGVLPVLKQNNNQLLKKTNFTQLQDSLGVYLVQIEAVLKTNDIAPLSYVKPTIEQIVINKRKQEILKKIEKEITIDAIKNKNFELFTKN